MGLANMRRRQSCRYCNTAISETLREAHPRSVRAMVCSNMEDCLPAYRHLVEGVPSVSRWLPECGLQLM